MNPVIIAMVIFLLSALVALGKGEYAKASAFGVLAVFAVAVAIWDELCGLSIAISELRSSDSDSSPSSRPPQPPCSPISAERNNGDPNV